MSSSGRFYSIILFNTLWEVPERYQKLRLVGEMRCSALDTLTNNKVTINVLWKPFQSVTTARVTYLKLKILKHMKHENIVGLIDMFSPPGNSDLIYLVDHYTISLSYYLDGAQTRQISTDHVKYLVYQLLKGLRFVHSTGFVIGTLGASNIGINKKYGLKILSTGLAKAVERGLIDCDRFNWYRAPEILLYCENSTESSDVWSVGCIMVQFLTQVVLFPGRGFIDHLQFITELLGTPSLELLRRMYGEKNCEHYLQQLPVIKRKNFWTVFSRVDPSAISLLEEMLVWDPDRRITVGQALEHQYFDKFAVPEGETTNERILTRRHRHRR